MQVKVVCSEQRRAADLSDYALAGGASHRYEADANPIKKIATSKLSTLRRLITIEFFTSTEEFIRHY